MAEQVIFHIDVNSAFLSWSAIKHLRDGNDIDLRTIPSAVGGSQKTRHGIILAKSAPAKVFNIKTGEPIVKALQKCPELLIVPPDYEMYVEMSHAFIELLKIYSPSVEQYSIDEAFCDMTGTEKLYGSFTVFAHKLKDTIKNELGFTVNIGVSSNRLLAKMASDFKKPDMVHTLYPNEIENKFWPLPIEDLFFVGKRTAIQLRKYGISTIGDLARSDLQIIQKLFKKHGELIWNYANGVEAGSISHEAANKGYSNMLTIQYDVSDAADAKHILLSLCETVCARIRADGSYISVVGVSIVDSEFIKYSRQTSLNSTTNVTERIYEAACTLFDQCWNGAPIRQLGIQTGRATSEGFEQYNIFDLDKYEKLSKLNTAIDSIRGKYGDDSVKRACFVDSECSHMTGGINKAKRNMSKTE